MVFDKSFQHDEDGSFKMVCYFTNWAVQRPGLGSMIPEHMDPCLCTHIIYGFSIMKNNELYPMEKYDHADGSQPGYFERINNLKKKNPKLRTLLAVGGWAMGMADFTKMVKTDEKIAEFVESSVKYLRKWKFDGLDLDFEYPGIEWRGSPKSDKQGFTKLCKMLRDAFEAEALKTGNERLLLTAAVAGAKGTIDKAYEVAKVSESLDWFNLMTYDLHGPWDQNAGHHSALYGKYKSDFLNIDFIIKYFESKGAPRNKLVVGLASYGRSSAPAMPYTGFKNEAGFLAYYETCLMIKCENWEEHWNKEQKVPYAKGKYNQPWAGYDNVKSMKIKADFIVNEGLAGAMFWAIDLDDFTGKFCCQGHYPLIRTVKSILENDPSWMPSEKICESCPNLEYKTLKKKYKRAVDNSTVLSPTLADSIMPSSLYTCKVAPDYSKNPDYIKCHACLSENDVESSECKNPTNSSKIAQKWCNSITQKCFSKAIYDSENNTLIEFSRGCASLSDLAGDFGDNPPSIEEESCVETSDSSKTCISYCDSQLCNTISDLQPEEEVSSAISFNPSLIFMLLNIGLSKIFFKL